MEKHILLLVSFCLFTFFLKAQQTDSFTVNELNEVIVTATRTEQKLGNVAVPATIISQKTIQQSGTLRLDNILQEQSGLFITNMFGSGVEMQGLSPDYTLILLNGQPLIGRTAGVLDLSRISVNNIKRIEIVKGPSSSLYGSEAMGGVINIITDKITKNELDVSLRYGRFNSVDANINTSFIYKKFNINASLNRNSTSGYDFIKSDTGKTVQPFYNYTAEMQLHQQINDHVNIGTVLRYFYEKQTDLYTATKSIVSGNPSIREYNINPYVQLKFNDHLKSEFRGYFSQYQITTKDYAQGKDSLYYDDFFQQRFLRIEDQTDWRISSLNALNIGAGYIWERLNTNRYSGIRKNTIGYVFLQDEHHFFNNRLTAIGGIRYDNNAEYASRISPKIALHIKANSRLRINASYGAGFKAPDYRQLYLNFTNPIVGYTVYGANETSLEGLQEQLNAGILSSIDPNAYNLKQLQPEYSKGLNFGATYRFNSMFNANINLFRNDIDNLIVTETIATKLNAAPVFSYFNVNKAYTEGAEFNVNYQVTKHLKIESGYQFLITADKQVLQQIKLGQLFGKDVGSLESVKLARSDYGGLDNRSKHMANLKFFYENKTWFASLREIYRSRWGVKDADGNLILNRDDEYAKGFAETNISAGRTFNNGLQLMLGIDNIFNYKDVINLPQLPGTMYYAAIKYFIRKN